MAIVIADTSGLISFISLPDSNHQTAIIIHQLIKKNNLTTIVPGDIFTEIINTLGKKINHNIALEAAKIILGSEDFIVEDTNAEIRGIALEIFKKQANSVSFTDCLVMAFADYYHTKLIFGFDEIFQKNHYTVPK